MTQLLGSLYLLKRSDHICLHKHSFVNVYVNVHNSVYHNNQKVEILNVHQLMTKMQCYHYSAILFNNKRGMKY
jgi:hypothetical protein